MREAVIVSAARTPIGKAYRGAYNNTGAPTLGSYSIKEAISRAGIEASEVEDVHYGLCATTRHSSIKYWTIKWNGSWFATFSTGYDN